MSRLLKFWPVAFALPAWAAAPVAPVAIPSPFLSLLQVVLALALVLGLIMALAWGVRRLQGGRFGLPRQMRVVSGLMVGQREKVVIVEIDDEWLVLGVTPQRINLLDKRPRPEHADEPGEPAAALPPFAQWLKDAMARSKGLPRKPDDSQS